ncbi:hypothetical protein [Nostoc commune]|nr:hypothetical protein [Nostoc commune]
MMGAELVRIISPLAAIAQRVASTMRVGVGLMEFVKTAGVEGLPTSGVSR